MLRAHVEGAAQGCLRHQGQGCHGSCPRVECAPQGLESRLRICLCAQPATSRPGRQGAAHWRAGGLGCGGSWESPLVHARAPSPALSWPHVAGCLPHPECTALSLALCLPSMLARGLAEGPNAGLSPRLSVVSGPCPHRLFQHLLPARPVQEGPPGPRCRPCRAPGWPRPSQRCPSPGCVRLRGELPEERPQHPDRLRALHVHICCHRGAALQGEVFLLHRRVQGAGAGLQVSRAPPRPRGRAWALPACTPQGAQCGLCWTLCQPSRSRLGPKVGGRPRAETTSSSLGPRAPAEQTRGVPLGRGGGKAGAWCALLWALRAKGTGCSVWPAAPDSCRRGWQGLCRRGPGGLPPLTLDGVPSVVGPR